MSRLLEHMNQENARLPCGLKHLGMRLDVWNAHLPGQDVGVSKRKRSHANHQEEELIYVPHLDKIRLNKRQICIHFVKIDLDGIRKYLNL